MMRISHNVSIFFCKSNYISQERKFKEINGNENRKRDRNHKYVKVSVIRFIFMLKQVCFKKM